MTLVCHSHTTPSSLFILSFFHHADAYCAATAEVLVGQELVRPRARVWLRPQIAQVHVEDLDALETTSARGGSPVVSCTGIVQALSTDMHRVYSRCFK